MLTQPLFPMGISSFRSLIGISDRYLASVGGYPYVNVAVLFQKSFIRNRALPVIGAAINEEFKKV